MKVFKKTPAIVQALKLPGDITPEVMQFAGNHMLTISRRPDSSFCVTRLMSGGDNPRHLAWEGYWIVMDDGVQVLSQEQFDFSYETPTSEAL